MSRLEFHIISSIWKSSPSPGTTVFQWLPRDISEILKGLEVNRQDSMDRNLNRLIKFSILPEISSNVRTCKTIEGLLPYMSSST